MTTTLTTQHKNQLNTGLFSPKIVVKIKGYPYLCTGEPLILDSRLTGQTVPDSYNLIDLKNSQKQINQQLQLEKGGSSSTLTFKIRLTDKDEIFTNLFSFQASGLEILEADARVYFGVEGGEFPRDFVPFLVGTCGNIEQGSGYINLSIQHPDKLSKTEVFQTITTELDGSIDATTTTIILDDASELLLPVPGIFRTYVKIDDEIIEYTGVSVNTLTGVIRGSLTIPPTSTPGTHDDEAEVSSFYELIGNTREIALMLLLSGGGETDPVTNIFAVNDDGVQIIPNAIYFDEVNIQDTVGATIGDYISLTSITFPGNDFVKRKIIDFGQVNNRSFYVVDGAPLTTELTPDITVTFQSFFDVLPDGAALKMHQVDQPAFDNINDLFNTRYLDFNKYIKETIKVAEFIENEVFLPTSFYHLPRLGRYSIGAFSPPLTDLNTIRVDETTVKKDSAPRIVAKRSVGRHFFNYIQYFINDDSLDDKLLTRFTLFSADSTNRIPAKNTGIKIESGGLRRTQETTALLQANANNIIERYRYGAEEFKCSINYAEGIRLEIGDSCIFGSESLQISDSTRGDRRFRPRICQVINKSISFLTGDVTVILLDTAFNIFSRFGIVSPASKVLSVVGNKVLGTPYCPSVNDTEVETWTPFINTRITMRLPDFSYNEEFQIVGVNPAGELTLNPTPDLSFLPVNNGQLGAFNKTYTETDLIIESTEYAENNLNDQAIWKDTYVYFNPRLTITNVIDSENFEVDNNDILAVIPDSFLLVHSPDFSLISQEVQVDSINLNTITVKEPLTYTPSIGDHIDLVGFIDGGFPYRWF